MAMFTKVLLCSRQQCVRVDDGHQIRREIIIKEKEMPETPRGETHPCINFLSDVGITAGCE